MPRNSPANFGWHWITRFVAGDLALAQIRHKLVAAQTPLPPANLGFRLPREETSWVASASARWGKVWATTGT
jgi:hypothetical protein